MWYILYPTIYYRLVFFYYYYPPLCYKRDGWTIIKPKSYAHAAVTTSVSVSRFRPHSACCSYFQNPSIVMFPSIYRCVFFLSIFFPTLNNRISDILWGGKLIFFLLSSSLQFLFFYCAYRSSLSETWRKRVPLLFIIILYYIKYNMHIYV